MTTKNPMGEEKPIITTGIGRAKGAYRTLPMPVRYAINFALVAIFIMRMMPVMGVSATDMASGSPSAVLLFVLGLLFGGVCAALCGLVIGIPALRLKGDCLAIITLGFAEIIRVVMLNIDNVLGFDLTGGAKGLTGIPKYTSFLDTFVVVAIVISLIYTFMKIRHGRAVLAIRDNEIAAEASGLNTTYYKTLAFVVSAFFAGVGGGLYAGCIGVMAPAKFGFMKSVEILVMIFRPQGLFGSYDFSLSRVVERVMNGDLPWKKGAKPASESGKNTKEVGADE